MSDTMANVIGYGGLVVGGALLAIAGWLRRRGGSRGRFVPPPKEPLRRVLTPPQLRIAASFTELENGNWLWRAQLEDAPDFFMVGVAASAPEAKLEAAESAQMLERRRREWQL